MAKHISYSKISSVSLREVHYSKDRGDKKKAHHPAGFEPKTSTNLLSRRVLYRCATTDPHCFKLLMLGYGGRITLSGKVAGSILASAVFFCVTCLDDLSQLINIQQNGENISLAELSVAFTR